MKIFFMLWIVFADGSTLTSKYNSMSDCKAALEHVMMYAEEDTRGGCMTKRTPDFLGGNYE